MAQRELDEFDRLEQAHPHGVSAGQIVEFFAPRGVKLAQATFRKYVQLGLLPRSRRVGEKGKHRGSRGLYPASAARRIHLIKSLMDEGLTLEDIRGSFIYFRGQLDGVERSLDELFAALDKSLADKPDLKPSRRKELERLLLESRHKAAQFVKEMEKTVSQITAREEPGKGP
jgi:DNA-binding transcriptional MerR regulator